MLEDETRRSGAASPLKLLTVSGAFRLLRAYGDIEDSNLRRAIVDLVERIGPTAQQADALLIAQQAQDPGSENQLASAGVFLAGPPARAAPRC